MKDSDYEQLKLRSLIVPEGEGWPESNLTHWQSLRAARDEARSRVAKVYAAMNEIDGDANLSLEGKEASRRKIAEAALASFEKSTTLESARASVGRQLEKWAAKVTEAIRRPEPDDAAMAARHAEVRKHIANIKEGGPAPRLGFIDKHYDDVIDAVLSAPGFLSGLTDTEYNAVRQKFEKGVVPAEVAEGNAAAAKALSEAERGWRMATKAIAERGNLDKRTLAAA